MSESTGVLGGHVQVFNLEGLSNWNMLASALQELLKVLLRPGGRYVEVVSHIYIINASSMFSAAWKVIVSLLSARTAAKISVSINVPSDLVESLDPNHVSRLSALLRNPCQSLPEVLKPRVCSGHAALSSYSRLESDDADVYRNRLYSYCV